MQDEVRWGSDNQCGGSEFWLTTLFHHEKDILCFPFSVKQRGSIQSKDDIIHSMVRASSRESRWFHASPHLSRRGQIEVSCLSPDI